MSNSTEFGAAIIKTHLEKREFETIEDLAQAAMKAANDENCTWWTTNDEDKYRSALGAILMLAKEEDRPRVEVELQLIQAMNAMITGIPVDMAAMNPDNLKVIGLQKYWQDAKEQSA